MLHTCRSKLFIIRNTQTTVDHCHFSFVLMILMLFCRHDRKGDEKAVQHPRCKGDQAVEQVHEQHLWASQQTWQHHSRCRPLPRTGMDLSSFIWNSLNTSAEFFSWSQPKKVFDKINTEPSKYGFLCRHLLFLSPVKICSSFSHPYQIAFPNLCSLPVSPFRHQLYFSASFESVSNRLSCPAEGSLMKVW